MKNSIQRMVAAINAARVANGERTIVATKPNAKRPKCVGCFRDVHSVGCPNRKAGRP